MASKPNQLEQTYQELSKLFKNPTRALRGVAAGNQETELAASATRLHRAFERSRLGNRRKKRAIYFKVLSLLYEVDVYRGLSPRREDDLDAEAAPLIKEIENRDERHQKINFKDPEIRSLWKAKIRCCVSQIESKRKSRNLHVLADELRIIETFTKRYLHRVSDRLPAWTTLAFVEAAQARIARENRDYAFMQDKLLSVDKHLDERAREIVEKLSSSRLKTVEREQLTDDLVFIRQKQTLASLFNVGLAAFQRGFLRTAENACRAARLPFRLHGQFFDRLFNDLNLISIERARTRKDDRETFERLKAELDNNILPHLKPTANGGNPRFYLAALRELAVLQYYCAETDDVLETLKTMEDVPARDPQLDSRIGVLRARVYWRRWVDAPEEAKLEADLQQGLIYAIRAFDDASGLEGGISTYTDAKNLRVTLEASVQKSLIDVMESLLIYSSIQLGLRNFAEALKSATTVIELAADENPRLLAMGHLAMAETYIETNRFVTADQHLSKARILERQIDHAYVRDRRIAVEARVSKILDLRGFEKEDFAKAQDRLLGWFIEHCTSKASVFAAANDLRIDKKKVQAYLDRLASPAYKDDPYRHLTEIKRPYRKRIPKLKPASHDVVQPD